MKVVDIGDGTLEFMPNVPNRMQQKALLPEATIMELVYVGCNTLKLVAGAETIVEVDVGVGQIQIQVLTTDDGIRIVANDKSIAQIVDISDETTCKIQVMAEGKFAVLLLPILASEVAKLTGWRRSRQSW